MKILRILGLVLGGLLLLCILLCVAVFWIPAIPTSLTNTVVASLEDVEGRIDRIDLDWNGLTLGEVDLRQTDGPHLQLAAADVQVNFLSLLRSDLRISRLHATGVVADLRQLPEVDPGEDMEFDEAEGEPFEFEGVLRPLRESGLRLWMNNVRVEGEFLLPEKRGGTFQLTGGGIQPETTGELISDLVLTMAPDDASGLSRLAEHTVIAISQDDEGFTEIAVTSETAVASAQLDGESRIAKAAGIRRIEAGEAYTAAIQSAGGADVLSFEATFAYGQDLLSFVYAAEINESTIAEWGLAGTLPAFSLLGNGDGSVDLEKLAGNVQGTLSGSVTPPDSAGEPALPEAGFQLAFSTDSDGETATVETFTLQLLLAGDTVIDVGVPQPLILAIDDPLGSLPENIRLAEVELSVPLVDLAPGQLTAGRAEGRLTLEKRGQALVLESPRPLAIEELIMPRPDQPDLGPLTLQLAPGLTYEDNRIEFRLDQLNGSIDGQPFMEGGFAGNARLDPENAEMPLERSHFDGGLRIDLAPLMEALMPAASDGSSAPPAGSFTFEVTAGTDGQTATLGTFAADLLLSDERVLMARIPQAVTVSFNDPVGSLPEDLLLAQIELSLPLAELLPDQITAGQIDGLLTLEKRGEVLMLENPRPLAIEELMLRRPDQADLGPLTVSLGTGFTYDEGQLDFHLGPVGGALEGRRFMEGAFAGSALIDPENESTPLADLGIDGSLRVDLDTLWDVLMPPEQDAGNQGVAEFWVHASMPETGGPATAQATVRLNDVAANDAAGEVGEFAVDLFAELSGDNALALRVPIRLTGPSGLTELDASIKLVPPAGEADPLRFEAELGGEVIYADDFLLLAEAYLPPPADDEAPDEAPTPAPPEDEPAVSEIPDTEALWAGVEGRAAVDIKRIELIDHAITDLLAELRVDEQAIDLSQFSAAFAGEPMTAAFKLGFTPNSESPYNLQSGFQVENFDLASLDETLRGEDSPALIDGVFTVNGRFHGNGPNLPTLPDWLEGEVDVQATEATFYPLGSFSFGDTASGLLGQLGGLASGLLRGRDERGYAAAVEEITRLLQGVRANQLTVETTLREGLDFSVDHFQLLSPQLSFVGSGRLPYEPGKPFSQQTLTLDLEMAAKGNAAHALNSLRLLQGPQNEFGYYVGPQYQNSGPIGSPTSTLVDVLKGSATAYFTRDPIPLPKSAEESPSPEDSGAQPASPLDALRGLLGR